MRKHKVSKKTNNKRLLNLLLPLLCVFLLFIAVGFSALSTTLSVNGNVAFAPVGMIRVMSITTDSLVDATEQSKSITPDSIKNMLDLNSSNATAKYNVVIKNLGQTDKELDNIVEDMFSNEQIEYELNGLQIGDVIEAREEVQFSITFKYKENAIPPLESRLNSKLRFVFKDHEDVDPSGIVFEHTGACTFNGDSNNITGEECEEYWDKKYIDTGVYLYDNKNWKRDYEIGFTIEEYNGSIQDNQAVFVNTKYENANLKWPGLVFRHATGANNLELTQSINNGTKVSVKINNQTYPLKVKLIRTNDIVYYSLNDGEPILLQNMTNFNQQFDISTWFGAAPNGSGTPFRVLKATLSNMYIKVGENKLEKYTITFDPNGGTVDEPIRRVYQYAQIGQLPVPETTEHRRFEGWYTDTSYTTKITESYIPTSDMILYAKWSDPCPVKVGNKYYKTISAALENEAQGSTPVTIQLLEDITEKVIVKAGKNVTFDFNGYTIYNVDNANPIIENNGTLNIISGTFNHRGTSGVINNTSTGTLTISGGNIIASNTKQAVYNDGGTVTITGNANLSSVSSIRATVHNLNNGTMNILGGTIIGSNFAAVHNEDGNLTIGIKDGNITSTPVIQGKDYGVMTTLNYNFYDGTLKGKTAAVNDTTKIVDIEDNSQLQDGTEVISGETFKTLSLIPTN